MASMVAVGMSRSEYLSFERKLKAIYSRLGNASNRVKKGINAAVKEVTKAARREMAREITRKVNIKQKDLIGSKKTKSEYINTYHKTSAAGFVTGEIVLSKTKRLQLIYFGARQNNKGVSYKIEKKGPRKFIKSAFIMTRGKKSGTDNNFQFVTKRKGKSRLPIAGPLRGPSPWGVFVKSGMVKPVKSFAAARLRKALNEQVRLAIRRSEGVVRA